MSRARRGPSLPDYDDLERRARLAKSEWSALDEDARTPEAALRIMRAHGFAPLRPEPFVFGGRWSVGSVETFGPATYNHGCVNFSGPVPWVRTERGW